MRYILFCFCLLYILPLHSVWAQNTSDNAYNQLLERLKKQQEDRAKAQEEAIQEMEKKGSSYVPPSSKDPRVTRNPNLSKDPRESSPSRSYPSLKRGEDSDINVCPVQPFSDCMLTLTNAEKNCTNLARTCGRNTDTLEDPSCKIYTCDAIKASCMAEAYGAYGSCLAEGKRVEVSSSENLRESKGNP